MSEQQKIFSQRLKQVRTNKCLLQDDLAKKVNVTRALVGHWENARREPNLQNLVALADALEVSLDYLVGRSDKP